MFDVLEASCFSHHENFFCLIQEASVTLETPTKTMWSCMPRLREGKSTLCWIHFLIPPIRYRWRPLCPMTSEPPGWDHTHKEHVRQAQRLHLCVGRPRKLLRYFFKWLGNVSTHFYSWHKWKLRFSQEEQITETITQNPNLRRTVTPVPEKAVKGNSNYAASRPRFSTKWVEPHTGNLPDRRRHRRSDYCKPYIFLCSLELQDCAFPFALCV